MSDKSRNTASSLANRCYRTETSALWKFNELVILEPRDHMEMNLSGAPMETSMRAADRAKTVGMSLVARSLAWKTICPASFPLFWRMLTAEQPVAAFTAAASRGSCERNLPAYSGGRVRCQQTQATSIQREHARVGYHFRATREAVSRHASPTQSCRAKTVRELLQ